MILRPKYFILLVSILTSLHLSAKDYYVSKDGNNDNSGTKDAPFKTIQKAANVMSSGDTCFIMEGVYREQVTVKNNNVTFQNYDGAHVTVSGADLITGWTAYKDGIYQADFDGAETEYSMLFAEGKHEQMARWPDNETSEMMELQNPKTGYARCNNKVGGGPTRDVTFFDDRLNSFPVNHWEGGIFRQAGPSIRNARMGIVASSNGTDLKVTPITDLWLTADGGNKPGSGNGFGFILHLNALDREGEWFEQDDKIYYMPRDGQDPNDLEIEAKNRRWAFVIRNQNNVTITGINIKAAALELKNASNCNVTKCSVKYLFPFLVRKGFGASYTELGGIFISGNNNTFKDCYVGHTWGNAFSIQDGNRNTVENCLIEDIGWIGLFTASVQNRGFETQIIRNTFGSNGRFHIRSDKKIDILNNDLFDCMKMGQDAGSIQITNGGRANYGKTFDMEGAQFAYNKIHDSSTIDWDGNKQFVLAFYLEGCSNYTVHHNLIYNIKTDIVPDGTFAYLGPRYTSVVNAHYYNNTIDNIDFYMRVWNRTEEAATFGNGSLTNVRFWNNLVDGTANDSNLGRPNLLMDISVMNEMKFNRAEVNGLFRNATRNNYQLKAGAAAIDQGRIIPGFSDDFEGAAPDLGCYEFGQPIWTAGSTTTEESFDKVITDPTLSIIDNEKKKLTFNIFPNPAKDQIFSTFGDTKTTVQIFSLTGKELVNITNYTANAPINLQNFSAGLYIIRVSNKTKTATANFIKN